MKIHSYITRGRAEIHQVPIGKGNFFYIKSKNAKRRHLENVLRKRYRKFEASKSMERPLQTTCKKRWMEKKQQKEDDNILSPKYQIFISFDSN